MATENAEQEQQKERGQRKTRVGYVVSDKMDKTIVVNITRRYMHSKYRKFVKDRKHYKAHDEANECNIGDKVLIEECRPLSRHKRWRLKEILEKSPLI